MRHRQNVRKAILLISFILYPITFFIMSPDLLMFGASEGVAAGDVFFFAGLFLLSLVLGRLFCGWICPAGALQEAAAEVNGKPVNNRWNWIKFILFLPWLGVFVFLAVLMGGGVHQADFFYKRAFGVTIVGITEWVMYFGTVGIILIMALAAGKRGFCHYLCWVSPFMIVGGAIRDWLRFPAVRLKTAPGLCNSCKSCTRKCPMSLPVDKMVKMGEIRHSECILCATCVDECPRGVIHFKIMTLYRINQSIPVNERKQQTRTIH